MTRYNDLKAAIKERNRIEDSYLNKEQTVIIGDAYPFRKIELQKVSIMFHKNGRRESVHDKYTRSHAEGDFSGGDFTIHSQYRIMEVSIIEGDIATFLKEINRV